MATARFDADTALERRDGAWMGEVRDGWSIGPGPNGGYVASFLARALVAEAPFPDPLTMTAHFVARPALGPVRVEVEPVRVGRAHATLSARLVQDGEPVAVALATFGRLRDGELEAAAMPAAASPEATPARRPFAPIPGMSFPDRFEFRTAADWEWPPTSPRPAKLGGWTRLVDRDLDAVAVPLFMDSWPPPVLLAHPAPLGTSLVPTLELTVHWRDRPRTRWHLALFHSRHVARGYVEEDGELWGEDGRLVAQSRQLSRFVPGEAG